MTKHETMSQLQCASSYCASPPFNQLARYLCAAAIGFQVGIKPETALRHYVSEHPGQFWQLLAESVQRTLCDSPDLALSVSRYLQ